MLRRLTRCGSRNDISFMSAAGTRAARSARSNRRDVVGRWIGFGTNLFQALGTCPPSVATAPISALRKKSVRATCHPPRLPGRGTAPVVGRRAASRPMRPTSATCPAASSCRRSRTRSRRTRTCTPHRPREAASSKRSKVASAPAAPPRGTPASSTTGARSPGRSGSRLDQVVGDRQEDRRLGTRATGQPVVGVGGGVREPRVEHDQLRAVLLALDDPLRVGVEVVAGLQMGC